MKAYLLEGSATEVIEVMKAMQGAGDSATSSSTASLPQETTQQPARGVQNEGSGEKKYVSSDFARRVLNRRPLSDAQRAVLKTLHANYPAWVFAQKLQDAAGYSAEQLAGVMGALGRRLTHTDGYSDDAWLIDIDWDYEVSSKKYRLPESVKTALEAEGLV